ncbi:hypothetical protein HPB47_018225 [Ixodes persulcatus]|uniref:Uncharacterized protein n=1 Tax=Ixodes persulcatus TaxID=34615 RepID=A0AC60QLH5_IXOPE|nr:hypothetical protein HPB47_018225 [Ixodes persulcatus]
MVSPKDTEREDFSEPDSWLGKPMEGQPRLVDPKVLEFIREHWTPKGLPEVEKRSLEGGPITAQDQALKECQDSLAAALGPLVALLEAPPGTHNQEGLQCRSAQQNSTGTTFLALIELEDGIASAIVKASKDLLTHMGLNTKCLLGTGVDNTSMNTGVNNGVFRRMKQLLYQMYSDPLNKLYLLYVQPILREVQRTSKAYEKNDVDPAKLLEDLKLLIKAVSSKMLILMANIDPLCQFIDGHLDPKPYLKYEFEKLTNTVTATPDAQLVRQCCTAFTVKLSNQLRQRLPLDFKVLQAMA